MNYKNLYYRLISKAKTANRNKKDGVYYESHHILPRSMGGSDQPYNLILLTAREHFMCHMFLAKFTTGKNADRMARAALLMGKVAGMTSRKWSRQREGLSRTLSRNHRNNIPIKINGTSYPSKKAAMSGESMTLWKINKLLLPYSVTKLKCIYFLAGVALMRRPPKVRKKYVYSCKDSWKASLSRNHRNNTPVSVFGIDYPSKKAAMESLELTLNQLNNFL